MSHDYDIINKNDNTTSLSHVRTVLTFPNGHKIELYRVDMHKTPTGTCSNEYYRIVDKNGIALSHIACSARNGEVILSKFAMITGRITNKNDSEIVNQELISFIKLLSFK